MNQVHFVSNSRAHLTLCRWNPSIFCRILGGKWKGEMFNYRHPVIYSVTLTSPRCESPRGPLVSGLTMMTLTPGRILEENIGRDFSFRDNTTTSITSLGLWPVRASNTQIFLVNNQYLLCLTPWVEDSVALLVQPASPWGTRTKDGLSILSNS